VNKSGLGYGPTADSCVHGKKHLVYTKCSIFCDYWRDYQLLYTTFLWIKWTSQ